MTYRKIYVGASIARPKIVGRGLAPAEYLGVTESHLLSFAPSTVVRRSPSLYEREAHSLRHYVPPPDNGVPAKPVLWGACQREAKDKEKLL